MSSRSTHLSEADAQIDADADTDADLRLYDLAIIGAGPIGIELAVACKKQGVDYIQFDAKQVGYTMSWWAPQTRWFSSNERISIAGVPLLTPDQNKATREQYLAYLRMIVEQFDLHIHTYEPVTGLRRDDDRDAFALQTAPAAGPRTYRARRVVLAVGGTDFPRKLGVPGEDLPHVSHYFHEPHTYFRKRVVIVGGKNSAVEAALRCHHAGAAVALVHRRAQLPERSIKYWLTPEITGLLHNGRVEGHFNSVVTRITPTHVHLARTDDGHSPVDRSDEQVPADFVLLLVGYLQDKSLLRNAGVDLNGSSDAPLYDPTTMQTNVPGLYLAGTAVGGTQERYHVFLENCHVHVERIMRTLYQAGPTAPQLMIEMAES